MEENFNIHVGKKLRMGRLSLGLTQTKVANAINVTFQQIQKYEKGTNGVSSSRLLQLSNFLKIPVTYFYENYTDSKINSADSTEDLNYSFLIKTFGKLSESQKLKGFDLFYLIQEEIFLAILEDVNPYLSNTASLES